MKIECIKDKLAEAVNRAEKVAGKNPTLPVLSGLHLKTNKNTLTIRSTNLDLGISTSIAVKTIEPGEVVVPAHTLNSFLSSLSKEKTISLSVKGQNLHVATENTETTIKTLNHEEFPIIPETKKGTVLKINTQEFKQKLQQVVFAASNNESRPVLTGVFLFVKDLKLYLVSTDGSRLSENIINNVNKEGSLLVPSSAINNLIKTIADEDEEISIIIDNQQVCFEFNDTKFICRLLEDKYPQYQNLIPKSFTSKARVNKVEFINMVKIANLFAKESARSITIDLDPQNQEIKINSLTSQIGENTSKAKAEIKGSGQITLNSKFLMEALNSIQGTVVDFCFNSKTEPILIKDTTDRDYTHIIMPLKV